MKEGVPEYQYISPNGAKQLDDSVIYDDGIYPIQAEDMEYIATAPQMESKLRSIVDMLPEIESLTACAANSIDCDNVNGLNGGDYWNLLAKLEKWRNE